MGWGKKVGNSSRHIKRIRYYALIMAKKTTEAQMALDRLRAACRSSKVVTMVDPKEFGEVLRYHRKEAGITLNDMAKNRLGISAAFLSDCELGKRNLSDRHQLKFIEECMK